jgi:hypothetical protein
VHSKRQNSGRRYPWERLTQRELLAVRLCDLDVAVEGTWLEDQIARVRDELAQRNLRFNPHFWLSDEWFSPTGVPGVALPFYLAHPKLTRLERSQMLEAEGATVQSCMRLLRHELGHAIQHAFNLQRRREWQRLFGKASTPYPEAYRPNPASRRYVLNLDAWYAQSHPEEDFAETFAVWLRPRYNWRHRYQSWPALRKLKYVDRLMAELAGQPPAVRTRATPFPLSRERMTLGTYYQRKRAHYSVGFANPYDRDLKRLFSESQGAGDRRESAATFLRRHRLEIRSMVAKWTGEYQFTLNQVLDQMIGRCKELRLVADSKEHNLVMDFAIMLTVHGMNYVYRGREWHVM